MSDPTTVVLAAGDPDPLAKLPRSMPIPDAAVKQVRGYPDGRLKSEGHHHGDNFVVGTHPAEFPSRGRGRAPLVPGPAREPGIQ